MGFHWPDLDEFVVLLNDLAGDESGNRRRDQMIGYVELGSLEMMIVLAETPERLAAEVSGCVRVTGTEDIDMDLRDLDTLDAETAFGVVSKLELVFGDLAGIEPIRDILMALFNEEEHAGIAVAIKLCLAYAWLDTEEREGGENLHYLISNGWE